MSQLRIPKLLTAGDTIGIVAPGRKLASETVDKAVSMIRSWDVNVILGKNIYSDRHSYLSGDDVQRLEDFQSMIDNPAVRCIICARGGYGSSRFVDRINMSPMHKTPMWLVGFSDVTALHLRFLAENVASIHGTMPVLFPKPESQTSVESIRRILFEGKCEAEVKGSEYNRTGSAKGSVVGGNLSLIVESLGTATEIQTDGKILLLEEVDEYAYRLDRMMNQLMRAGKLKNLKGLVIGHMTDIKEGDIPFGETIRDIIARTTRGTSYPIAFNFPSGHENPNFAWVQGANAKLDITEQNVRLTFDPLKQNI